MVRMSFDLRYQPKHRAADGTPGLPGLRRPTPTAPSRSSTTPEKWARLWLDTREALARAEDPLFNRWDGKAPACA